MKEVLMKLPCRIGPFNACPGYNWKIHAALLAPLTLALALVVLRHGWWGEDVRQYYLASREALPALWPAVQLFSDMAAPVIYALYLIVLAFSLVPAGVSASPGVTARRAEGRMLICRLVLFGFLLVFLTTGFFKFAFGIPRPGELWPPHFFTLDYSYHSFPSGHTTEIVAAVLPLAFFFRKKIVYIALALFIALVGYSRIWLGWHHPVDILGGMLWGGLIARVICCSPCSDTAPEPPNPVPFHGKSLSEPPLENTSIKKRSKEQA